jgi:membrane-associated phospholipid phosphatase
MRRHLIRFAATRALALGCALTAAAPLAARPASAQSRRPGDAPAVDASLPLDGAVIAVALALAGAAGRLPVDSQARWPHELVPLDDSVKRNFSSSAARTSDLLLTVTMLTPLALQAGQGFEAATGRRALVYAETLALSLALNGITKHLVGRPRPYVYNPDPRVQAYARREAKDSCLSFYSGHAATAFAAAVSGAYLFSQSTDDTQARTAAWAGGLLLAGATANLRVRGGKHFYSDVAVGAALGTAAGLVVPMLHQRGRNPLTTAEWVAIAAAPLAGAVLSQIVPLPADITEPLVPTAGGGPPAAGLLAPWISGEGAGVTLLRTF